MGKTLAIGVMASMAPQILRETLAHWPAETCRVYVHVDAKFDIADFSFIGDFPVATAISERHSVMWGGFSLVEAEISLMRAALADGFEHFLLTSDDTVPLLPVDRMIELSRSDSAWYPLPPTGSEEIWDRYKNYYCADIRVSNPRARSLDYSRSDMDHLLDLHMLMKVEKFRLDDLYWTANWKALAREDVEYIVASFQDRGHMWLSFKYSLNPDEHYIPTLLGRRPQGMKCVHKFIWADFGRSPSPYVLQTRSDADEPVDQDYWFARKVHDPVLARDLVTRNDRIGP